jgi:hypothetical protein
MRVGIINVTISHELNQTSQKNPGTDLWIYQQTISVWTKKVKKVWRNAVRPLGLHHTTPHHSILHYRAIPSKWALFLRVTWPNKVIQRSLDQPTPNTSLWDKAAFPSISKGSISYCLLCFWKPGEPTLEMIKVKCSNKGKALMCYN